VNTRHAEVRKCDAQRIVVQREQKVLIDADLAALYVVETRRLNEQVRRNRGTGFPPTYA
jgi:ORF6N domain